MGNRPGDDFMELLDDVAGCVNALLILVVIVCAIPFVIVVASALGPWLLIIGIVLLVLIIIGAIVDAIDKRKRS
jgi:hypothetical protein